ncbi:importin subunit alpha-like [Asparagus officinalis]|uniref:importin subunit alpha-like n=1 Tax=Asparagus officinalis TaxID=4686 RepID=UPI00098E4785|nr:importin subunit alpha-like [Asparagus officinalis]
MLVNLFIIDNKVLHCLLQLLTHNYKKSIKKEAYWTLSNITAGTRTQIQDQKILINCGRGQFESTTPSMFFLNVSSFKMSCSWPDKRTNYLCNQLIDK